MKERELKAMGGDVIYQVLARKLAAIEGTEDAVVTGSGMAAISSTLLCLLRSGDHLLIQVWEQAMASLSDKLSRSLQHAFLRRYPRL